MTNIPEKQVFQLFLSAYIKLFCLLLLIIRQYNYINKQSLSQFLQSHSVNSYNIEFKIYNFRVLIIHNRSDNMQNAIPYISQQVQQSSQIKKQTNVLQSQDSRNSTKLPNLNNDSQSTNAYAYTNNSNGSNAYPINTENKDYRQINFANPNLDGFRLFTFMNCRQQSFDQRKFSIPIDCNLEYQSERTYYPTKESYLTQIDSNKMVQIINKSRKKRLVFQNQLQPKQRKRQNILSISNVSNNSQISPFIRKSKTPKASSSITPKIHKTILQTRENINIRLRDNQVNYEKEKFNSITPSKMSKSPMNCQKQTKLFRAKSSLGDFKKSTKRILNSKSDYIQDPYNTINQSFKASKSKLKDKSVTNLRKSYLNSRQNMKQKEESTDKLLKKKKQLEKQLIDINQSLLMKKNRDKKKNAANRPVKKRAY